MAKNPDSYDLRWAREARGMSQQVLADLAGVTRLTIIRWENGQTPIPRGKLDKLLELLEVKRDEIPDRPKPAAVSSSGRPTTQRLAEIEALIPTLDKECWRRAFSRELKALITGREVLPCYSEEGLWWNVQLELIRQQIRATDMALWRKVYATGIVVPYHYDAVEAKKQYDATVAWWEENRPSLI